jgi:hypothetical protein
VADWLDSADKVASVVGALAGVAALVVAARNKNRHPAPNPTPAVDATAPGPMPVAEPVPDTAPVPFANPVPTPPPPTTRRPAAPSILGELGAGVGLLVYCAGTVLLGTWLLSWLGGGSIGPWWLLAGLTVSRGVGLLFSGKDALKSGGEVLLYVFWVPVAAWLSARGAVYYWFPDLFGNQGVAFIVIIVVALVLGAIIGLVRASD